MRFDTHELRDLLVAWLVLGVAFTLFFAGGGEAIRRSGLPLALFVISLSTAGVGFLLHELAHKVLATRFGQRAEFRADYTLLVLAVLSALIGLLVAAPGAVHHRGSITARQHGLIALAGPATNVGLVALFLAMSRLPGLERLAGIGVLVNAFLAAFNMLPVGGLDGRTVAGWSWTVFGLVFALCVAVLILALRGIPVASVL